MCCFSFLGQVLYGAVMLASLGLTLAAMFSPGWTQIKDRYGNVIDALHHPKGLFAFLCGSSEGNYDVCRQYFDNLPGWEKTVVIVMCLAVIFEAIALIWTIFTICACCCKKYIIHPLPALAFCITVFLAIAVIVFGVNNKDVLDNYRNDFQSDGYRTELGYSFYLAIGALAGAVIDIIIGGLTATLATKNL